MFRRRHTPKPDWRNGRRVFRLPEASELSFSRLHFLRTAEDYKKLGRVVKAIYRRRGRMTEAEIKAELDRYRRD